MNYTHKHVLTRGACRIQKGFIAYRQMLANVVELDARAHCFALCSPAYLLPLIVLFDFSAAFPSVSHTWLFMCLEAMKFPTGFINVVRSLYSDNIATHSVQGRTHVLFRIVSGILQGCPLSGFLFAVVIDPFLRHCVAVTKSATPEEHHATRHSTHAEHQSTDVHDVTQVPAQNASESAAR